MHRNKTEVSNYNYLFSVRRILFVAVIHNNIYNLLRCAERPHSTPLVVFLNVSSFHLMVMIMVIIIYFYLHTRL